jgi:transcriptional regulator with XRE-family HTH domain
VKVDAAGRTKSIGRKRLLRVLETFSRKEVARVIGVAPSAVGHLATGRNIPQLLTAFRLKKAYGIDPESWVQNDDACEHYNCSR